MATKSTSIQRKHSLVSLEEEVEKPFIVIGIDFGTTLVSSTVVQALN
jgi:hypothetical protein